MAYSAAASTTYYLVDVGLKASVISPKINAKKGRVIPFAKAAIKPITINILSNSVENVNNLKKET